MILLQLILFYAAPAYVAVTLARRRKSPSDRIMIVHIGILASILLLSYVGAEVSWDFRIYNVAFVAVGALLSLYLLGLLGLGYAASSAVQEWCLLLAGVYLLGSMGFLLSAVISALVYALAHNIDSANVRWKLPLTFLWGCCSILLYLWLREPLLNIALHTVVGALLIRKGLLFTTR